MRERSDSKLSRSLAVAIDQWRREAAHAEALVVAALVVGICAVVFAIGAGASAPLLVR
jgi:hypothetical protein